MNFNFTHAVDFGDIVNVKYHSRLGLSLWIESVRALAVSLHIKLPVMG
jgi:hypothetical protein